MKMSSKQSGDDSDRGTRLDPGPSFHDHFGALNPRLVGRINARAFVYRHDLHGVFTWLSPSITDVLGYAPGEFLTNYHTYLTDNPTNVEAERHTNLALKGIAQPPYEVEIFHKDGSIHTLEIVEIPIRDEEQRVLGLEGMALDITERRQVRLALEALLREKESLLAALSSHRLQLEAEVAARTQELRTLIANVPGVVFRCDAEPPWAFRQISEHILALTGRTVQDCTEGRAGWRDFVHPDDMDSFSAVVERATLAGQPFDLQFRVVHADGGVRWVHERAQMVHAPDGAPLSLDGVLLDVTEHRRAEAATKATEQRLQSLVETINEWVWEVDENAVYRYASPKVRDFLGYEPEELLGLTPFDLMPNEEVLRVGPKVQGLFEARAPIVDLENVNVHKNGQLVLLETSGAPFFGPDGEFAGYRGVDRNITNRKRLEESLQRAQKLESIGVLAGGIAHDFNNLLGGLFGHVQLARLANDTPSAVDAHLAAAEQSFEQARSLTRQLLTFAKGGDPVTRVVRLSNVLEQSARMAVAGASCRLELDLAPDLWPCEVDEHQIAQVINNLCLNAVQAMRSSGTLHLRARNRWIAEPKAPRSTALLLQDSSPEQEDRSPRVVIEVEDTGVGIAPEVRKRIFEPFFTTKSLGSGLGLATCYSIVRKHGGTIDVVSEPGKGATFIVSLRASLDALPPEDVPEEETLLKGTGTILIMDDEPEVLTVAAQMLEQLGYRTCTARDGAAAVDEYEAALREGRTIDAVILDLTVPGGMGGIESLSTLRRLDPHVCAVASSGYSDDPVMAQPREFGFCVSLAKPYQQIDLGRAVAQALEGKKSKGLPDN
jgi:PAS domain S-box-containing protein